MCLMKHMSLTRSVFALRLTGCTGTSEICSVLPWHSEHWCKKLVHTSSLCRSFWEKDRKGGYRREEPEISRKELVRDGLKELRHEFELWKEEVKDTLTFDPVIVYRPGEVDIVWKFDKPEKLDQWITTSDQDHGEGYSSCELKMSRSGKGLFSGQLTTKVPKDGRIKKAGYCNMKSMPARKSFKRDFYYNWRMYTHLVMRVRGDGRSYLLNISTPGYFDILWNDSYHYILFTRGGPHWQTARIPFSKFFLSSKGRVQDRQSPIPLERVGTLGISAGDKIDGPFYLEIDYIGLEFDPYHTEEFAYEMYKTDKYIVGH